MRNPPKYIKYKGTSFDSEITLTIHGRLNNFLGSVSQHVCSYNSFLSQNLFLVIIRCYDGWIFLFDQRLLLPYVCSAANAQELGQLRVFMSLISISLR